MIQQSPLLLNPVVHWAQQHKQKRDRIIRRRIRDFEILLLEQGTVEVQIESLWG
jgi:hypothetical protein